MIEELAANSRLLRVALDRYLRVCSAIEEFRATDDVAKTIPQEVAEHIKCEVNLLLTYESKLREAKTAIIRARNSAALAPASILPPEILAQIFRFVLAGEMCSTEDDEGEILISKYPERLSRVCSRWRQVAIGLSELWTHIDLSPDSFVNQKFVPRARAYSKWSGELPLFIHVNYYADPLVRCVSNSQLGYPSDPMDGAFQLIASLAARTRVLDLDIEYEYSDFHHAVLESCLKGCVTGVFSRLVVRHFDRGHKFIKTNDSTLTRHYYGTRAVFMHLDLSEQDLESILFQCTALYLDGIFLPWASRAYHGLTQLSLTCIQRDGGHLILESEFLAILRASPQLRILEFDLRPGGPLPHTTPVEFVSLPNLEKLAIWPYDVYTMGELFRWIAPGPNSLSVLMGWPDDTRPGHLDPFTTNQLQSFFGRSNVGRITVSGFQGCNQVSDLLRLAPRVPELVLESTDWDNLYEKDLPDLGLYLHTLYILESDMHMADLIDMVEAYRVRELVLWRYSPNTSDKHLNLGGHAAYKELARMCPKVSFIEDSDPRPVAGWS